MRVYPQNLNNIAAPLAVQINPTVFFKINGLAIGQTKEFKLTGTPVVNAGAKIVAELCDYNGDVDSQACSIVNLGAVTPVPVPAQDDEGTW